MNDYEMDQYLAELEEFANDPNPLGLSDELREALLKGLKSPRTLILNPEVAPKVLRAIKAFAPVLNALIKEEPGTIVEFKRVANFTTQYYTIETQNAAFADDELGLLSDLINASTGFEIYSKTNGNFKMVFSFSDFWLDAEQRIDI